MPQEDILCEGIIKHAPAAADNRLAFACHVVRKRHARSEVVVILVVQLSRQWGVQNGWIRGVRIKAIEQLVLLAHDPEIVPANTQIQGQLRRPAEAVLDVKAMAVLKRVAARVALPLRAARGCTLQESGQVVE